MFVRDAYTDAQTLWKHSVSGHYVGEDTIEIFQIVINLI